MKASGKIKTAGWVFLTLSQLWLGLVVHSGWVHYHESAGTSAYNNLRIPDELALARTNPVRWLSAGDQANIADGKKHLHAAADMGLFVNADALPKLAWVEYLSGNTEQAIQILGKAADHQSGQGKALSLYYRGAILNRLGRYGEGLASLDSALAERPDLIVAREERGESLWQLGRRDEAFTGWTEAVERGPGLVLANYMLAGASVSMGKAEQAAGYEKQAEAATPNDPLFHWMVGLRLQNVGMNELAEKHFQKAIQLNPAFSKAR